EIRNGVVSTKDYSVITVVLPHEASQTSVEQDGYGLIGRTTIAPDLVPDFGARSRHTNYWIGWPGGCEGCIAIEVGFRNDAVSDEIQQVGKFDFSCLTRWLKPCRDK